MEKVFIEYKSNSLLHVFNNKYTWAQKNLFDLNEELIYTSRDKRKVSKIWKWYEGENNR